VGAGAPATLYRARPTDDEGSHTTTTTIKKQSTPNCKRLVRHVDDVHYVAYALHDPAAATSPSSYCGYIFQQKYVHIALFLYLSIRVFVNNNFVLSLFLLVFILVPTTRSFQSNGTVLHVLVVLLHVFLHMNEFEH